jgi:hypothetical protein
VTLVLLWLLAAPPARPFSEDRLLLDRRLETLRRILPDGPNPPADAAVVRDLAVSSKLQSVEALARPVRDEGARGSVPIDLGAVARFADVERFFRQVALHHRLIDVESLTLAAAPDDSVRLTALLAFPFRPARAPLAQPPDGTRARLSGVPKPQADAYVRDLALAVAKSETIAALRRARRNPRLFLCELAAVARDRPVVFSYAGLADEFVVRGQTVGEGPTRALESRFERGFFRVSDFLMRRQSACVQFEVRGHTPVAGAEAELPLPADDPFEQDDAPCRVDRDQGRSVTLKGAPAKGGAKAAPKGPLTLRLRDLDLADVFFVLHRVTGQAFAVDGDVSGRASLDLAGVTLEQALAALQKAAGIRVSEGARIRRVTTATRAPSSPTPAPDAPGGAAATFLLKRAEVRDVLAALAELDPSLASLGPLGSYGRASVWAAEVPLLALRAALLASTGLVERMEEDRRLLERPGSDENLVPVAAGDVEERRLQLRPQDLVVAEFELAGVASGGEGFWAFAYSPTGTLNAYRAGDRLFDGTVQSVDSTDTVLAGEEGPVRVLLPQGPR